MFNEPGVDAALRIGDGLPRRAIGALTESRMTRVCTAFNEPHHQFLELGATRALSRGDARTAFELADRRCRIAPPPEAHSYLLRAEALVRLGERTAAIADIARALALAPDDIRANRRMLAWARGKRQAEAAATLIAIERNVEVLRRAIEIMRNDGRRGFAAVTALEDALEGWAAWDGNSPLEVAIADGVDIARIALDPDPSHEFGDVGYGRWFRVPRPPSSRLQSIVVSVADRVLCATQAIGRESVAGEGCRPLCIEAAEATGPTVVVPVYGDYEATKACLESLLPELDRAPNCRVVIVNDASPDRRITSLLARIAKRPRVQVLVNARNLGFIGAVNRALREIAGGDVLLLNADTIVPPNFVRRLAAAAALSPDIGMVMPVSNNGDLASFPIPFAVSPIGGREDVESVDLIAAEVNADQVVDIPNGIGFCLYVTRACLDAIGVLSEDFERGYLEDVDYSLRARAHGFRIVCAPSVYVGHAGSKSFGGEKRSLVVRNSRILHARHPDYSREFSAFGVADPLRKCRQAIARRMIPRLAKTCLLIAGAGVVGAVARSRGRRLAAVGEPVLMLEVHRLRGGSRAILSNPSGGEPQSTQFDLCSRAQWDALIVFLKAIALSRIEIFDPIRLPFDFVAGIRELGVPYDMAIADAGLLGAAGAAKLLAANGAPCGSDRASSKASLPDDSWVARWRAHADDASAILAMDEQARAFAARLFPKREVQETYDAAPIRERRILPRRQSVGVCLGFLPIRPCAEEQRLLAEIAHKIRRLDLDIKLVTLGAALDDVGLMRIGNMHVTGPVEIDELEEAATSYGVDFLFASVTQPLFGHPLLSAARDCRQPLAYFDWSSGTVEPRRGDLPLDPDHSVETIAIELLQWFGDRTSEGRRPRNRLH
jgi:GT2 family glycosyltransferase